MIIDSKEIDETNDLEADICIIGSGPAGITIANDLLSSGLRIILLESGGLNGNTYTQDLYSGFMQGQKLEYTLDDSRLRLFGGTSNHWVGSNQKLDNIDFIKRDWIPYSGWPINAKDLEEFYLEAIDVNDVPDLFNESKNYNKSDEVVKFLSIFKKKFDKDIDIVTNIINPVRFGDKFYKNLNESKQIKVLLHFTALKMQLDNYNNIKSIFGISSSNKKLKVKSKVFILAMGGIENARFLLLHLDAIPYETLNKKPIIGAFFQEHYTFNAGTVMLNESITKSIGYLNSLKMNNLLETETYFLPSQKIQKQERMLNSRLTLFPKDWNSLLSAHEISRNDLSKGVFHFLRDFLSSLEGPYEWTSKIRNSSFSNKPQRVIIGMEQAPNERSRVSLSSKTDRLNQRKAILDWRINSLDESSIRKLVNWFGSSLGKYDLGRIKVSTDSEIISKDNLKSPIGGGYHHMGTTRMGENKRTSVVDANCKYHQLNNLFLAGSSIFPTSGSTNPTLTIVATAKRLAKYINEKFKKNFS